MEILNVTITPHTPSDEPQRKYVGVTREAADALSDEAHKARGEKGITVMIVPTLASELLNPDADSQEEIDATREEMESKLR